MHHADRTKKYVFVSLSPTFHALCLTFNLRQSRNSLFSFGWKNLKNCSKCKRKIVNAGGIKIFVLHRQDLDDCVWCSARAVCYFIRLIRDHHMSMRPWYFWILQNCCFQRISLVFVFDQEMAPSETFSRLQNETNHNPLLLIRHIRCTTVLRLYAANMCVWLNPNIFHKLISSAFRWYIYFFTISQRTWLVYCIYSFTQRVGNSRIHSACHIVFCGSAHQLGV